MNQIILASASSSRLSIMQSIGFAPDHVIASNIDESFSNDERASQLVRRLAISKAQVAYQSFSKDDYIIGADTLVAKGRRILCKPKDAEEAYAMLEMLSGCRHRVYSAVCLIHQDQIKVKVAHSILKFKRLSASEIEQYVKSNEWKGKCGGYSIRGRAGVFLKSINGLESTVVGLPCNIVYNLFASHGVYPRI